jgi:hypothetical protein
MGRDVFRRWSRLVEDVRRDDSAERWPSYVYAPMAAAYAIVSGHPDARVAPENLHLISTLNAAATWRLTKGVYRFDPSLRAAILATPLDRALPTELFERLPEWCVWVDLEDDPIDIGGELVAGYYVHLEWDGNTRATELRLLVDSRRDGRSEPLPITYHLVPGGTLADCADEAMLQARATMVERGATDIEARGVLSRAPAALLRFEPLVSLALYLCSQQPDLTVAGKESRPPKRTWRDAKGAQQVTTWDVGARLGAALRWAQARGEGESEGGEHAAPRAHVRRAHWHTYWVGSEAAKTRRRELRWLAPILVSAEMPEDLAAVVRQVKE